MQSLDAFGDMNRMQVQYNHATLQAISRSHQSAMDFARDTLDSFGDMNRLQVRYNHATLQAMGQMYERQNNFIDSTIRTRDRMHNHFTQMLMVTALTIAALTFCVGYYMAENNVLRRIITRQDLNNIGNPFPATPAHEVSEALPVDNPVLADGLLTSVITFGYALVRGYLYIPSAIIAVVWDRVTSPLQILYVLLACLPGWEVTSERLTKTKQLMLIIVNLFPLLFEMLYDLLAYPSSFALFPTFLTITIRAVVITSLILVLFLAAVGLCMPDDRNSYHEICWKLGNLDQDWVFWLAHTSIWIVFMKKAVEGFGGSAAWVYAFATCHPVILIISRSICESYH